MTLGAFGFLGLVLLKVQVCVEALKAKRFHAIEESFETLFEPEMTGIFARLEKNTKYKAKRKKLLEHLAHQKKWKSFVFKTLHIIIISQYFF